MYIYASSEWGQVTTYVTWIPITVLVPCGGGSGGGNAVGKGLTERPLLFEYCGVNAGSVAVGLLAIERYDLNQALRTYTYYVFE